MRCKKRETGDISQNTEHNQKRSNNIQNNVLLFVGFKTSGFYVINRFKNEKICKNREQNKNGRILSYRTCKIKIKNADKHS